MPQPSPSRRTTIVEAARALFAERGFHGVTVRQIAAAAGVSPALVIKLCTSKAGLYAEAGLSEVPITELDLPRAQLGTAYVRRIEQRRRTGAPEPWSSPSSRVRYAVNPGEERQLVQREWLGAIAAQIGDHTPHRVHAAAIACLLVGFAEGLRVIGVAEGHEAAAALSDYYSQLVQHAIDQVPGEPG